MKVYEAMNALGQIPAGQDIGCFGLVLGRADHSARTQDHIDPETLTWAEIDKIGKSGAARQVLGLGSRKTIKLADGEDVLFQIIGFDHDELADGSGKAPISWDMFGLLGEEHSMNDTCTNAGGWGQSGMRKWLNGELFDKLPEDLKRFIKPVIKKTSAGEKSKEIAATEDRLWLKSEKELFGRAIYSVEGEGHWYEFYKQEDTPWSKREENGNGSAYVWWLRSPYVGNAAVFCNVSSNGTADGNSASNAYGVAAGFCV